jgi:hypothetical protein
MGGWYGSMGVVVYIGRFPPIFPFPLQLQSSSFFYSLHSPSPSSPPPSHTNKPADLAAHQSIDQFSTRKPAHTNHTRPQPARTFRHHHLIHPLALLLVCWWLDPSSTPHPSTWAPSTSHISNDSPTLNPKRKTTTNNEHSRREITPRHTKPYQAFCSIGRARVDLTDVSVADL